MAGTAAAGFGDASAVRSAGWPARPLAALSDWTPVNRLSTSAITPTRLSALLCAAAMVCWARL